MKRFFLFALVATLFAACVTDETQDVAVELAPDTLTVSFEGDDSRIQLQNGKTVWTQGDLVSVFYRSDAHDQYEFQGKTGDTEGTLKRTQRGTPSVGLDKIVAVYPYNSNYLIELLTGNIQAFLPATQNYAKDSYGIGSSIMISSSRTNTLYMKNVCGWLKVQLKGEGQIVKSITIKGNNGEQVAGNVFITADTAECTLATALNGADENNSGDLVGTLVEPNTILTEVSLDCGDGVELGAEPTAFYIALPPQTFEKGLTVKVVCDDFSTMTKTTENSIAIERNAIQPMAAFDFDGQIHQIFYTSWEGSVVPYNTKAFGANIISNTCKNGEGVIIFDAPVTEIGEDAFFCCDLLKSITIPDSVTAIGSYAFEYCFSLTSISIPDSVTSIGDYAFSGCTSLTSISIPDSVTSIGDYAFSGCTSLTSVTIGNSVTSIGEYAFYDCRSLTAFYGKFASADNRCLIVDGVLNSFAIGCGLTEYTIPDSVTEIGDYAFAGCRSLTSITIPDSVTSIGKNAFRYCRSLTAFYGKFASADNRCLIVDGVLNSFAIGCGLTEYTIPDSITSIGDGAFYYCTSLTSVTIPNSVTSIGEYAFYDCRSLTSVKIGNSVTSIGEGAFYDCRSLTSVKIGNNVTSIGEGAFYYCYNLTSITIPDSVTSIGEGAFLNCVSLKEVYCKPTTPPAGGRGMFSYISYNGDTPIGCKIYVPRASVEAYKAAEYWREYADNIFTYDFETSETVVENVILYTATEKVTPNNSNAFGANIVSNEWSSETKQGIITFDGNITSIGNYAFDDCTSLTSITIPDSVTSIGNSAFSGCTSLTSVTIPESVTEIGQYAFRDCTGELIVNCNIPSASEYSYGAFYASAFTKVTIGEGVTSIGDLAFAGCTSLTSVTFGNGITSIGNSAFSGCTSLTSVTIPDSVTSIGNSAFYNCTSLTSITIPDSVTEIGYAAFYDCTSLTSITIPDSVTSIGDGAFYGCSKLTSVTIGNSVTSIGYAAFFYCTSMTSITIPDSVTEIGMGAFYDCTSLKEVYCKPTTPPAGSSDMFYNNASGRKIYVPTASVEAYKAASYWSDYASYIEGYDF